MGLTSYDPHMYVLWEMRLATVLCGVFFQDFTFYTSLRTLSHLRMDSFDRMNLFTIMCASYFHAKNLVFRIKIRILDVKHYN